MTQYADYLLYLVAGLVLLVLAWPLLRWFAWKLFSFDREINKILHQKKSSEVRLGKISETLSPLIKKFPVDIEKKGTSTVFLGQPIDYLYIDPDNEVVFVEVKSGNSKLNASQRKIKKLISEGRVRWAEFRV